jgi:hypothetical protein
MCTDINATVSHSKVSDICFFGAFMVYMVEGGFGMNSSSKNDWTLTFRKMVSVREEGGN